MKLFYKEQLQKIISQNYHLFQISALVQKDIYTRSHVLEGKFISKNLKDWGYFLK